MANKALDRSQTEFLTAYSPYTSKPSFNRVLGVIYSSFFLLAIPVCIYLLFQVHEEKAIELMSDDVFQKEFTEVNFEKFRQAKLIAIGNRSMLTAPPSLEIAKGSTLAALKKPKPCLSCEIRLVYIDIIDNKKLTKAGSEALRRSYNISPYGDVETMKWRLQISNIYWNDISSDLQKSALSQITAISQSKKHISWLFSLNSDVEAINTRIKTLNSYNNKR